MAINNNGVVVGNGGFNTNNKGFVYCNGEYTVLVPPGWQWASAGGINDNGVVIGNGKDVNGAKRGFIAIPQSTLIHLSSFTATPKAGKVIIQWSTEAEIDNAGFNIYRAESEYGNYIKINSSLVPAQGSSTQGASYEFVDKDVQNRKTYYYKLEDIDLNGTSTMHGPVNATPRWFWGIFGR